MYDYQVLLITLEITQGNPIVRQINKCIGYICYVKLYFIFCPKFIFPPLDFDHLIFIFSFFLVHLQVLNYLSMLLPSRRIFLEDYFTNELSDE